MIEWMEVLVALVSSVSIFLALKILFRAAHGEKKY